MAGPPIASFPTGVIDALDKTLIPWATNSELKALLIKVRPAVVAHLEHAKGLQLPAGKDS
jgi:putative membrane protein